MVQTVVDYDSWNKGYMPPSEHILIDQLSYRGARVVLGCDWGDLAMWVVIRGPTPNRAVRRAMREMVVMALENASTQAEPYEYETPWC